MYKKGRCGYAVGGGYICVQFVVQTYIGVASVAWRWWVADWAWDMCVQGVGETKVIRYGGVGLGGSYVPAGRRKMRVIMQTNTVKVAACVHGL